MEAKIDNLTRLLDKVVDDVSSIKDQVSIHDNIITGNVYREAGLGLQLPRS